MDSIYNSFTEFFSQNWVTEYSQIAINATTTTPNLFAKAGELVTGSVEYVSAHKNNKTLVQCLSTVKCMPKDEAKTCVEKFVKNAPNLQCEVPKLLDFVSSDKLAGEDLLKTVNASIEKTANNTMKATCAASIFSLVVEAKSLFDFWMEVRESNVFSSDKLVELIDDIQENLDEISVDIKKLVEEMNQSNFDDLSGEEKYFFHYKKSRKLESIRQNINDTYIEIGNLRGEVNGKIERLSLIKKNAEGAAVRQGMEGVRQTGIAIMNWDTASKWILRLTIITAILHFFAFIANIFIAQESKNIIKDLRKKLTEIRKMRKNLAKKLKELQTDFDDFTDTIFSKFKLA